MRRENSMEQEIVSSWERCLRLGVGKTIDAPLLRFENQQWEHRLSKRKSLVAIFQKCFREVRDFIPRDYMFLLTDEEGCLLHQETPLLSSGQKDQPKLARGASLVEESCGSNAINLALRLRKSIYFKPEFHYCDLFSDWYCFAIPLITAEGVKGCLDLSLKGRRMQKEMIGITKLLASNITNELHYSHGKSTIQAVLTKQQISILELFAKGLTGAAAALEMKLSENTIKYHRKQIFQKLAVQSIAEAVAKAVKLNLLPTNKG